jgi:hypothetical protein
MLDLDRLETRTVLSNVTVVYDPTLLLLTITGDTHNDNFRITETSQSSGGKVTVAPGNLQTLINTSPVAFVTTGAVRTINVSMPGTPAFPSSNTITLSGPGKAVATGVQNLTITDTANAANPVAPNLTVNANNLFNSGQLKIEDTPFDTRGGGTFNVTVSNSRFGSIDIDQTGCCPAHVTLTNDIAGPVSVSEGVSNGDSIVLSGDQFGSTTLEQGQGPVYAGCNGTGDYVCVTSTKVTDLTIDQDDNGHNDGNFQFIYVNGLQIATTGGSGVRTNQGDGFSDVTIICSVTAPFPRITNEIPYVLPGILVQQGNGDLDYADVANSTVPGNIAILQGNGAADWAQIIGSKAGLSLTISPFLIDISGIAFISQGDGANDVAVIDRSSTVARSSFNNVEIRQGNATLGQDNSFCNPALGDLAQINDTDVASNIDIDQGIDEARGVGSYPDVDPWDIDRPDPHAQGNNVAAIGFNALGLGIPNISSTDPGLTGHFRGNGDRAFPCPTDRNCFGTFRSSTVTAGGATQIDQGGGNNMVFLGDTNSTFHTVWLDVYTGPGGGGYVQAQNTIVDLGSFFGNPWTVDGGDGGNTLVIIGANVFGVDPSPNYAVSYQ